MPLEDVPNFLLTETPEGEPRKDGKRHPWERVEKEPIEWYQRFDVYRSLPFDRKLLQAVVKYNELASPENKSKPKRVPKDWLDAAIKWNWIERAEAWDEYEIDVSRRQQLFEILNARKRHAGVGYNIFRKGYQKLLDADPDLITIEFALKLLEKGISLELNSLGLPEKVTEQRMTGVGSMGERNNGNGFGAVFYIPSNGRDPDVTEAIDAKLVPPASMPELDAPVTEASQPTVQDAEIVEETK